MSQAVKKYNSGLNAVISKSQLLSIAETAKKEGQTYLYDRCMAAIEKAKEYVNTNFKVATPVIEQIPESDLPGIDIAPKYIEEATDFQGLNKAVSADEIYQYITDMMINTIEKVGHLPWQRTWDKTITLWDGAQGVNFESKKPYRGINYWMVNFKPEKKGDKWFLVPRDLTNPYFLTLNQIEKNGGKITKGAKATRIVYFTRLYTYTQVIPGGKDISISTYNQTKFINWIKKNKSKLTILKNKSYSVERLANSYIPILKYYNVFHGADVEGIDWPTFEKNENYEKPEKERLQVGEDIVSSMPKKPEILYKGNQPAYYPSFDHIRMTPIEAFNTENEYYSTLFHELIHSTGHKSRLARPSITLGTLATKLDYAKEELVAEMGAVFLCAESGILFSVLDNSAKYLAGWGKKLTKNMKEDNKFFFRASSQAQAAADFILDKNEKGVPAYQKGLKAAHHKGAKVKALDECGRLLPGYKYLKGGQIVKLKEKPSKPKKRKSTAATKKNKDAAATPKKTVTTTTSKKSATVPKTKTGKDFPLIVGYPVDKIIVPNNVKVNDQNVEKILSDFDLNKIDAIKVFENTDGKSVTLVEGAERLEAIKRKNYDNAPVEYVKKPITKRPSTEDLRKKITEPKEINNTKEFENALKTLGLSIFDKSGTYKAANNFKRVYKLNFKDVAGVNLELKAQPNKSQKGDIIGEIKATYFGINTEDSYNFYEDISGFYENVYDQLKDVFKNIRIDELDGLRTEFEKTLFRKENKNQLALLGAKSKKGLKGNNEGTERGNIISGESSRAPLSVKKRHPRAQNIAVKMMKAPIFPLQGETRAFLQNIERKPEGSVVVTLDSEAGGGKTTTAFKFLNDFAEAGNSCCFFSLEEHKTSNLFIDKRDKYLSEKAQANIDAFSRIKDYSEFKDIAQYYDVIFTDSWQKLVNMIGLIRIDEDVRQAFDGKIFVFIVQQTTDGRTKGGASIIFDGDIILKISKGSSFSENFVYAYKHRYTDIPLENLRYMIQEGKTIIDNEITLPETEPKAETTIKTPVQDLDEREYNFEVK